MDGDRPVGDVEISPGVEERVRGSSGVGKLVAAPTFSPPSTSEAQSDPSVRSFVEGRVDR